MSLSTDLLYHAASVLIAGLAEEGPYDVSMRRCVSASYYALFHQISGDAVALLAPNVTEITNHRIQRWFDHLEMKKICGRFSKDRLDQPLRGLIGEAAPPDLQTVCSTFVELQEARQSADYDLSYALTRERALQHLSSAGDAIKAWERIRSTAEANIFILSLLMFKNWDDKTRQL